MGEENVGSALVKVVPKRRHLLPKTRAARVLLCFFTFFLSTLSIDFRVYVFLILLMEGAGSREQAAGSREQGAER